MLCKVADFKLVNIHDWTSVFLRSNTFGTFSRRDTDTVCSGTWWSLNLFSLWTWLQSENAVRSSCKSVVWFVRTWTRIVSCLSCFLSNRWLKIKFHSHRGPNTLNRSIGECVSPRCWWLKTSWRKITSISTSKWPRRLSFSHNHKKWVVGIGSRTITRSKSHFSVIVSCWCSKFPLRTS